MKISAKNHQKDLLEKYDKLLLELLHEDLKRLKHRRTGSIPLYHFQPYFSPNKDC